MCYFITNYTKIKVVLNKVVNLFEFIETEASHIRKIIFCMFYFFSNVDKNDMNIVSRVRSNSDIKEHEHN